MTLRPAGAAELAPALLHLATRLGHGDPRAGAAHLLAQPRFNALQPLLHRAAQLKLIELNPAQRERCAHMYYQNVANGARVQAELVQVADTLAAAGIPLIVLKGSAFICELYAEHGLRLAGDLDLLVPPERLDDTARALVAQRYTLVSSSDRHGLRELAHPSRPAGKGNVDVHTRIGPWRSWTAPGYTLQMDALWQRARPLPVPGCAHPPLQLSYEDSLLFMGFQVAQHGFNKFPSYFDLLALHVSGAVADERLAAVLHGERHGHPFRVFTYCALAVAQALLGVHFPPRWLDLTRPSSTRRRVLARWANPERILSGSFPEDSLVGYMLLARSPKAMLGMSVSALGYLASKALGRERGRR